MKNERIVTLYQLGAEPRKFNRRALKKVSELWAFDGL